MKIERLEAHDRLLHLQKDQAHVITQGCEDCLKRNPDSLAIQSRCPYVYIFAHPRTAEDGANKRLLWQPRMSKPKAQTNSYLFRAISNTDQVEICWFIPPREMWLQFQMGNVTECRDVLWSIEQFQNNRKKLEEPYPDDISDERAKHIWMDIARAKEEQIRIKKMYSNPELSGPFQVLT